MTWVIAFTWTVSLILTGKIANSIGRNDGWRDCIRTLEVFIDNRKEDE